MIIMIRLLMWGAGLSMVLPVTCGYVCVSVYLVTSHLNRGGVSECEGGVSYCSILAELSRSVVPGKLAWSLNLALFWDTHTLIHTEWSLTQDLLLPCPAQPQGECIHCKFFNITECSFYPVWFLLDWPSSASCQMSFWFWEQTCLLSGVRVVFVFWLTTTMECLRT